eukprot:Clim_evm42s25 gene=Clim_evmTU42s25
MMKASVVSNDSKSLYNFTLSPGWSEFESQMLRRCAVRFGIGKWSDIIESGSMFGKSNSQLNLQMQRMLGQQSTAEFMGISMDPTVIGKRNNDVDGPDVRRKNGMIVNTGRYLAPELMKKKREQNRTEYQISKRVSQGIVIKDMREDIEHLGSDAAYAKFFLERKRRELEYLQMKLKTLNGEVTMEEEAEAAEEEVETGKEDTEMTEKDDEGKTERTISATGESEKENDVSAMNIDEEEKPVMTKRQPKTTPASKPRGRKQASVTDFVPKMTKKQKKEDEVSARATRSNRSRRTTATTKSYADGSDEEMDDDLRMALAISAGDM